MTATATNRGGRQAGSATVELVLVTPLLILLLLFVVALGRLAGARLQVDGAAGQAARAASLARDPAGAVAAAQQTAAQALAASHVTCQQLDVSVDTAAFRPGGWVAVTVTCAVGLSDMALLHLPGTETIRARFVSGLDVYRGVSG
jgi:Flp pilus assembly protein TadG